MTQKGFTLVEMAVVLVIISVIIAGIVGGQTLYEQSLLRSVIVDFRQFDTAYNSFYQRYKEPPGDFSQAASIWGAMCATTITCNGDGNKTINSYYNSATSETARAWKHLQLSEMIPQGIAVIPASWVGFLNTDLAPKSKVENAAYFMAGGSIALDTGWNKTSPFFGIAPFTNAVFIGTPSGETAFVNGALTPREALSIDIKFDDGKLTTAGAAIGNETGFFRVTDDQQEYFSGSACLTPDSFTVGATYNLNTTTTRCIAGFQLDKDR